MMKNLQLENIIRATGRKESQCNCSKCQKQCNVPCLGTPDDILKLIEAGYKDKLIVSTWIVGMMLEKYPEPIVMFQAKRTENGCVFFKNGLCELHDLGLKPTEGKLSHHEIRLDNYIFELSLNWNVAKKWIDKENYTKVVRICFLMSQ